MKYMEEYLKDDPLYNTLSDNRKFEYECLTYQSLDYSIFAFKCAFRDVIRNIINLFIRS